MHKVGIIDIGSNSVRLIIAQIMSSVNFRIIYEVKEAVRLGKDMSEDNRLDSLKMEKALNAISSFKTICNSMQVTSIIAVATEAVRRASNQDEFLNMIKQITGIEVRILSGYEEAYYDYMGVINSMDMPEALVMDIGGSSTEFIYIKDYKSAHSISIPYGSISLTDQYNKDPEGFKNFIISLLIDIPWVYTAADIPIIGIGGTFRNIGKIDRKRKAYPIDAAYNYHLSNDDLDNIISSAAEKISGKIKKIKGLSTDRSDIFIGPICALRNIINACGTKGIYISGSGVREGLLYEHILGYGKKLENVLDYSLQNILLNFEIDQSHAFRVYELTLKLYNQLSGLLPAFPEPYKIIKTAALLHDAGIKLNFYDHHKHTFYMILNSKINGLSHKELLMSAYVAALHRKDEFKIDLLEYKALLDSDDELFIQVLGLLLKIGEKLDCKMDGNIRDINCSFYDNSVVIKITSEDDALMEIEGAMACKNTFKRLLGRKLLIV